MAEPIPVAVVGVGYFGRLHARQYAANPAARLAAVVDIDAARARAVAHEFGAAPATDHRSLIGRVAAASVAVPTAQHFEVARDLPADYAAIEAVALKHGLTVVADAAQSFGGTIGEQRVGALAPVTATSFYPTKPLGGFGDGGAILTNDSALAEVIHQIRRHGTQGSGTSQSGSA